MICLSDIIEIWKEMFEILLLFIIPLIAGVVLVFVVIALIGCWTNSISVHLPPLCSNRGTFHW